MPKVEALSCRQQPRGRGSPVGRRRVNHYELLGLPVEATSEEIRREYRSQARRHHPDRFHCASPEDQAKAGRRMRKLNDAWAVLGNAPKRDEYDLAIRAALRANARATGPSPKPANSPPADGQTDARARAQAWFAAEAAARAETTRAGRNSRGKYRPAARTRSSANAKQSPEFVCQSCMLLKHTSQLIDRNRMVCRDCV
jgi:curved DNA-binding protein CbpA